LNLWAPVTWLASMVAIKYLLDGAVHHQAAETVVAAIVMVGVGELVVLVSMAQWASSLTVTERTAQLLDEELMAMAGSLPGVEHHERPEFADRLSLLRRERRRIGFAAYVVALNLRLWFQLAASVAVLAHLQPLLLLLPPFAVVSFVAQSGAHRMVETADHDTAGAIRLRHDLFDLATTARGAGEVRVFGLPGELARRHAKVAADADRGLDRAAVRAVARQAVGRFVFAAAYIASIGLVLARAVTGHATVGDVALAIALAASINNQVASAAEELAFLRRMVAAGTHYVWLLDYAAAQRARDATDPLPLPAEAGAGIVLDKVSFRYPGTPSPTLEDISITLAPGATVALVGENGSGKTTLVKLILRMYEPDGGRITFDGVDIARFDVVEYRRALCAAFQDFCRFELQLLHAVGVGDLDHVDDEPAVCQAVTAAGAEALVAALPERLSTQLGQAWGGVDLSGGEWQKLAVGRAVMRADPRLTIFDEPTAALDPYGEHVLFERLARRRDRGTVLLVSHRFSTVRMADSIVVLDRGRVVEAGTHDELVAAGGLYGELYRLQARAYE
jgi:ATP-binding cassette subfamily B protein